MELILKEDVINLGYKDDVVKVKVLSIDEENNKIALSIKNSPRIYKNFIETY